MPVSIKRAGKPIRRNRKDGYNRKVRQLAPLLNSLQAKGFVSPAQLADALRGTSLRTSRGEPYAESVIRGMLERGKELGLPLILRTRSEAQSAWIRKPRAPKCVAPVSSLT